MTDTGEFKRIAPGLAWVPSVVRQNFSAAAAWTLVGLLIGAGAAWERVGDRMDTLEAKGDKRDAFVEQQGLTLGTINTQVAVVNTKLDDMRLEMQEEKARWNRVDQHVAESVRKRQR